MIKINNDFYNYINSFWISNNPIPDDKSRWSHFDILEKTTDEKLIKYLSELNNGNLQNLWNKGINLPDFVIQNSDLDIIKKTDNCDKKKIVLEVMKSLFNLNNDEITKVDSSIECFWSNNMITKIKKIEKFGIMFSNWFSRKFL